MEGGEDDRNLSDDEFLDVDHRRFEDSLFNQRSAGLPFATTIMPQLIVASSYMEQKPCYPTSHVFQLLLFGTLLLFASFLHLSCNFLAASCHYSQ